MAPARDRQILRAAERLFFERGFHAVGMDEIGVRAGISGPGVYRHFRGKDEILGTLFQEALDGLFAAVADGVPPDEDPAEELRALAAAHAAYVVEHQELTLVMVRDDTSLAKEHRRRHQRRERPYVARWIDLTQRAFPDCTAAEATAAVFGALSLINGVGAWPRAARQADDLAGVLADLAYGCLTGLGAQSA